MPHSFITVSLFTFVGDKVYYDCSSDESSRKPCPLTCHDVKKEGSASCVSSSKNFACKSGCFCPPDKVELNGTNGESRCIAVNDCPCYYDDKV